MNRYACLYIIIAGGNGAGRALEWDKKINYYS